MRWKTEKKGGCCAEGRRCRIDTRARSCTLGSVSEIRYQDGRRCRLLEIDVVVPSALGVGRTTFSVKDARRRVQKRSLLHTSCCEGCILTEIVSAWGIFWRLGVKRETVQPVWR